jgi:hypothetical protein
MDAVIISAMIIGAGFLAGFVVRDRAVRRKRRRQKRFQL